MTVALKLVVTALHPGRGPCKAEATATYLAWWNKRAYPQTRQQADAKAGRPYVDVMDQ